MPCSECAARQRLLAEAEQLFAEKLRRYQRELDRRPFVESRLLGSYEHAVNIARENLEFHRSTCSEAGDE